MEVVQLGYPYRKLRLTLNFFFFFFFNQRERKFNDFFKIVLTANFQFSQTYGILVVRNLMKQQGCKRRKNFYE